MEDQVSPFNVISNQVEELLITSTDDSVNTTEQIEKMITDNQVFLFMKGTPSFPQCGFSANILGVLKQLKVPFKTFNVLSNFEIREGIKEFSQWPTIPQVYINGKFVGGNDIVTEMFNTGELNKLTENS